MCAEPQLSGDGVTETFCSCRARRVPDPDLGCSVAYRGQHGRPPSARRARAGPAEPCPSPRGSGRAASLARIRLTEVGGETRVSPMAGSLRAKYPDVEKVKAASRWGSLQPPVR